MKPPVYLGAFMAALSCVVVVSKTAEARGKSCVEVSDVVGYEHCKRFGSGWATERIFPVVGELGLEYSSLDPRGHTLSGGFGKNQPGSFAYSGDLVGHDLSAWLLEARWEIAFLSWMYAGMTMELGVGHNDLPRVQTGDGYRVSASGSGVNSGALGGGAVFGVRAPLGPVSVRLESLLGGRMISVAQWAASADYPGGRSASVSIATGLIEPRVHVDVWATPWMSVDFFGGANALQLTDRIAGIGLAFHERSYDGAFLW